MFPDDLFVGVGAAWLIRELEDNMLGSRRSPFHVARYERECRAPSYFHRDVAALVPSKPTFFDGYSARGIYKRIMANLEYINTLPDEERKAAVKEIRRQLG
jgi:hypothetical protein